jgi:hypothetical protein
MGYRRYSLYLLVNLLYWYKSTNTDAPVVGERCWCSTAASPMPASSHLDAFERLSLRGCLGEAVFDAFESLSLPPFDICAKEESTFRLCLVQFICNYEAHSKASKASTQQRLPPFLGRGHLCLGGVGSTCVFGGVGRPCHVCFPHEKTQTQT